MEVSRYINVSVILGRKFTHQGVVKLFYTILFWTNDEETQWFTYCLFES